MNAKHGDAPASTFVQAQFDFIHRCWASGLYPETFGVTAEDFTDEIARKRFVMSTTGRPRKLLGKAFDLQAVRNSDYSSIREAIPAVEAMPVIDVFAAEKDAERRVEIFMALRRQSAPSITPDPDPPKTEPVEPLPPVVSRAPSEPQPVEEETPPPPADESAYGQTRTDNAKPRGNLAGRKFIWLRRLNWSEQAGDSKPALKIGMALVELVNSKGECRYDPDKIMAEAKLTRMPSFYEGMKDLERDGCIRIDGGQRSANRVVVLLLDGLKITD